MKAEVERENDRDDPTALGAKAETLEGHERKKAASIAVVFISFSQILLLSCSSAPVVVMDVGSRDSRVVWLGELSPIVRDLVVMFRENCNL